MSTPFLYILFPIILGVVLLAIRRWESQVVVLGTLLSLLLAFVAWWLPDEDFFFFGPWYLQLEDTWFVLGRRFELGLDDRPAIMILYLGAAFWFGSAYQAKAGRIFVPVGMFTIALLTAVITVEPFLYAALFIAMVVLISVPILCRPGQAIGKGVLRYLTFQTLGTPFILLTGWILAGVETISGDLDTQIRALILMAMGFALLLAVFPFHSWVPMLAEECHPYTAAFVFLMLPIGITLFGLGFFDQFSWLRNADDSYLWLRYIGVMITVTSGIFAAVQRHLGRLLGFGALLEIGLSLIAIGLAQGEASRQYLGIFFAAMIPRGLGLGVWALALTLIWLRTGGLTFREVQGIGRQMPLVVFALVLANLSLVGLPLLAGFPVRLVLLEGLAQTSLTSAILTIGGSAGLLIGGLRSMAVLVMGTDETTWKVTELPAQIFFLGLGSLALILLGLFPQWFIPIFADLPLMFKNLVH
ncbi:MAG: proton-conducting transporter membrane subunit [Anaerolineales bacterium]